MKKISKKAKKLHTYLVSVNVTINSEETVKAKNWKEAIKKAKKQYFSRDHDNYYHGLICPTIDIDFPEYEDEVEIEK